MVHHDEADDHHRRNDAVFLTMKRSRPDGYARLLAAMTPQERDAVEQRVRRAERDERHRETRG